MNDPMLWILIILFAVLLVIISYRSKIIPEFEQVVIYRLGRFRRLAGPGPIFYNRFLDTLQQTIDVREKRQTIPVMGMFVYDIPFGFTLNLWMQFDPRQIAPTDHEALARLTHIAEDERLGNVRSDVKRALQNALAEIQQNYPLLPNAGIFQKLLPIIPGGTVCKELLELLRNELNHSLPNLGFVLAPQQEITIFDFSLNPEIIDVFNRGRLAKSLREDIPSISDEQIFEFLAKVKGLDMDVKRIFVDGGDGVDLRVRDEERELDLRIARHANIPRQPHRPAAVELGPPPWPTKRQTAQAEAAAQAMAAQSAQSAPAIKAAHTSNRVEAEMGSEVKGAPAVASVAPTADSAMITLPSSTIATGDEDWRVMKRVPRAQTTA